MQASAFLNEVDFAHFFAPTRPDADKFIVAASDIAVGLHTDLSYVVNPTFMSI